MIPFEKNWAQVLCLAATVLMLVSSQPVVADLVFSDSTFNNSDWSTTQIRGVGSAHIGSQVNTGGNTGGSPDPFRSVVTTANGPTTAHLNSSFVYDPADGAIVSISYAFDYKPIAFGPGSVGGHSAGLVMQQAGEIFIAPVFNVGNTGDTLTGWKQHAASGIKQVNVANIQTNVQPDFSVTGAPITFGFLTHDLVGIGDTVGYDNYAVTLVGTAVVPEPSAVLYLSLVGLTGAAISVWRNRKQNHSSGDDINRVRASSENVPGKLRAVSPPSGHLCDLRRPQFALARLESFSATRDELLVVEPTPADTRIETPDFEPTGT